MIYLGIDPGKAGAVARIVNDTLTVEPVPLIGREYDIGLMSHILRRCISADTCFAVIERAQAMPKQGVVGMFEFGKGFGIWLGILTSHSIPYEIVHSRVWTRELLKGLPGKGKERGVAAAKHLFPEWNPSLKKEWQYADAILLAEYARRLK
jgi:hypothetical protein